MEVLGSLAYGFSVALTPFNLAMAIIGCLIGTVVGALPGLGPTNGVAILIPVAFALGLPPSSALILLGSLYYGTMYGGPDSGSPFANPPAQAGARASPERHPQ